MKDRSQTVKNAAAGAGVGALFVVFVAWELATSVALWLGAAVILLAVGAGGALGIWAGPALRAHPRPAARPSVPSTRRTGRGRRRTERDWLGFWLYAGLLAIAALLAALVALIRAIVG